MAPYQHIPESSPLAPSTVRKRYNKLVDVCNSLEEHNRELRRFKADANQLIEAQMQELDFAHAAGGRDLGSGLLLIFVGMGVGFFWSSIWSVFAG